MPLRKGNENTTFFSFEQPVRLTLIFLLMLVLNACVSQKNKDELTGFGKAYHNMTAHYNGYFNANEIMIASEAALTDQYVENYNRILPIYPYVAADNPQAVASELDRAMKKVSVVVNLHRQSDWTDDCYLLLGKAQYMKQDYESSEHTLKYMTTEFTPEKLAKKDKKKKERKKKEKKAKEKKKKREKARKESTKKRQKARKSTSKRSRAKARKKSIKKQRKEREKKAEEEATKAAEDAQEEQKQITTTDEKPESPEPEISISSYNSDTDQPDNYFMKHKPAFQEGQLWLARTYIERERYNTAENLLYKLERNPRLFSELQPEVRLAQAHLYMQRKDYPMVIQALEQVLDMNVRKSEKARYAFIIGQLYQQEKQPGKAIAAFEKVLELNPAYDMAFRSKLNLVKNSYENGLKSREDSEKELDRMLKDDKNIEYRDQIYFVQAELDLDAGLKSEAIANLRNSLKNNVSNTAQRAESYYLLANLYFEQDAFVKSKNYFDSTLQVMNKIDERYNEVNNYAINLKEIAENIQIIEMQDSLLAIANMSDQDRRRLAAKIKEEQERAKQLASKPATGKFDPGSQISSSSGSSRSGSIPGRPTPVSLNSNFFAYNPKSLKKGERDFEKKWGDRLLEDNWRRSNKQGGELFEEEVAPEVALLGEEEIEDIFKDVPSSPDEIAAANSKIEEALFQLGRLFRDRLDNHQKAAESLEELIKRYPETLHLAEAYYYLYLAYTELGKTSEANKYKDLIAEKFPNTKYAGAILDPDYLEKAREEKNAAEIYYDETYALFKQGEFEQAKKQLDDADGKFKDDNYLIPKFALLEAMVTGKTEGREAYVASLQDIIAKYPGTDEERRSKEILRVLGEYAGRAGIAEDGGNVDPSDLDKFEFNEKELHYVIVAIKPGQSPKVNEMKATISNYNRTYHDLERLRTSSIYLGADIEKPIIVIRKYKDKNQAMRYYEGMMKNQGDFIKQKVEYEVFAITQRNYREVMREKSINNYRAFFEQNYLQ